MQRKQLGYYFFLIFMIFSLAGCSDRRNAAQAEAMQVQSISEGLPLNLTAYMQKNQEILEMDLKATAELGNAKVEKVYRWIGSREGDCVFGKDIVNPLADAGEEGDYDEERITIQTAEYLKEQGFGGQEPISVEEENGNWRLECYMDGGKRKICLIMRFYGGENHTLETVCCAVRSFAETDDYYGELLVSSDETQGITSEKYYNPAGMKCGEVSYVYRKGIPFRFITKKDGLQYYFPWMNDTTMFLEDYCEFDNAGIFMGTRKINESEEMVFPYLSGVCDCVYEENGRLAAVEEIRQEDMEPQEMWTVKDGWTDRISGELTFEYDDSGNVCIVEYQRLSLAYGTWKSSGCVVYDRQGRLLYDSCFSAFGCSPDCYIYLYKENESRPWMYVDWSTYSAEGFEDIIMFEEQSIKNNCE